MSLYPAMWTLSCDHKDCDEFGSDRFRSHLKRDARDSGWQLGVKLNGEHAKVGGKDYCPEHRRGGLVP